LVNIASKFIHDAPKHTLTSIGHASHIRDIAQTGPWHSSPYFPHCSSTLKQSNVMTLGNTMPTLANERLNSNDKG